MADRPGPLALLDGNIGEQRKALTSFSFGSNGFVLPPVMSDQILSCIADQTDVTGLMGVCTENLNTGVAVMKSAQDGA